MLAEHYNIITTGAHNAMHDCIILDKILRKCKITTNRLLKNMESFVEKINYWHLGEMKAVTPVTRKKLVKAGISLDVFYVRLMLKPVKKE